MAEAEPRRVVLGKITAPFGVKGWVKLQSWTEPPERIIEYRPWLLETNGTWREWRVKDGRLHGKSMIARLEGVSDRDRKSTRLNSSHHSISYAVFCLKK